MQDLVTLVDHDDNVIGSMDKIEAHRGEAQLHRAISVYLFNEKNELLIQQRSAQKIVGAHQWANTVCGNVRPTETYEECAYRRLREELGIKDVNITPIYKFEYHIQCNNEFSEWEMDQVYVGQYEGVVRPNPQEVQQYQWVDWKKLVVSCKLSVVRKRDFRTKTVTRTTNNRQLITYVLAPWFVLMLEDKELVQKIERIINI